jgi:hypothetical protein
MSLRGDGDPVDAGALEPAPGLSIYRPSLNPLATLAILGSSWWWACWRPPCRRAGPPDWIR